MMRQLLDVVRLKSRPGLYWRRSISQLGSVMVIPLVDGVPVVSAFEIVDKGEISNERDQSQGVKGGK